MNGGVSRELVTRNVSWSCSRELFKDAAQGSLEDVLLLIGYNRNVKRNVTELLLRETFQTFGLALKFVAVRESRKCNDGMPKLNSKAFQWTCQGNVFRKDVT